jgi:hypothetical protein
MPKKVPYLREEQIERDAFALLAEYAQARNVVITPPIPIEDIVEKHLKLSVEFDDTHRLFGVPRSGLELPYYRGFFERLRRLGFAEGKILRSSDILVRDDQNLLATWFWRWSTSSQT